MLRLTGAMTAVITPMTKDGSVDEPAFRALIERQIEGNIDGVVICGTTGESATLSPQEKLRLFALAVEAAAGRVPVIANTGGNATASSVRLTQAAKEIKGLDGVMAVCPYYNKPDQAGLIAHFEAVANVGMPTVAYNVPSRTVVGLTAASVARLARHPNIVALKEASANMALGTAMMAEAGQGLSFLSGDDFSTYPFVAMGGDGCISVVSNLAPGLVHDMVYAARRGDRVQGLVLHRKVNRLAKLCFGAPNPVPVKLMMAKLGWIEPHVRLPLVDAEPELAERLVEAMRVEGFAV